MLHGVLVDKREVLGANPMFRELNPQQIEELAAITAVKSYSQGQTLFQEGEACQGLFVIGQGSVKLVKTVPSGRQIVLAVEAAPNSVGGGSGIRRRGLSGERRGARRGRCAAAAEARTALRSA